MGTWRWVCAAFAAVILTTCASTFGAEAKPTTLTFILMDGSVITGSPDEPDLLVDTEFGRLKVPLAKLESFTPGLDSHPELGEKLHPLVAALDDPNPARQEQAKKELIEMGPSFRAVLAEFADDLNPARKAAIASILEAYKTAPDDDRLDPMQWQDRVKTTAFPVVGSVAQRTFKITTPYGVLRVDVGRVRQVNAGSGAGARTDRKIKGVVIEALDGAKLAGQTDAAAVTVETPYGKCEIPVNLLDTIMPSKRPASKPGVKPFEVVLWNEDRIEGALVAPETFAVRTEYGAMSVPLAKVATIRVDAAVSRPVLPEDLVKSLVLHYSFEAAEGGVVKDESPSKNDGKAQGGTRVATGKVGAALRLDGADDYVDAGNPKNLQLTRDFTLAAWVYSDGKPQGTSMILTKSYGYPEQARRGIELGIGPDLSVSAYFWDDQTRFFTGGTGPGVLRSHRWHFVVFQHDSSLEVHQMRLFIDGATAKLGFGYEATNSIPAVRNVAETWKVGCMRSGNHHFKGMIDEVMFFNRVLSAKEIALLYDSQR